MKSILALLLSTLLLTTAARADVFIYRGVDILTVDAATASQIKSLNLYLVVDFDAGQTGTILFGHIQGAKRFQVENASDSNFNAVSFPNGKLESIIVSGNTTNNSPSSFSYDLTLFRGANTSLLIRKTPNHTTALRPNVLKGTILSISNGTNYFEQHSALTFQSAATIKANNANQTISQVLADFAASLTAQGFISL